jgi:hypothetical protein
MKPNHENCYDYRLTLYLIKHDTHYEDMMNVSGQLHDPAALPPVPIA